MERRHDSAVIREILLFHPDTSATVECELLEDKNRRVARDLLLLLYLVKSFLKTAPFFMTKRTCSSSPMSFNGSPETATISAYAPGATAPSSPFISSISAAREVADWMAAIGDMPRVTMRPNSRAMGSVHGMPPMSVPKTILRRACTAFRKDVSCTRARARSRFPAGVSSGAQLS